LFDPGANPEETGWEGRDAPHIAQTKQYAARLRHGQEISNSRERGQLSPCCAGKTFRPHCKTKLV